MFIKCAYFDLDGTLLSDGITLTNRTLMAIEYLKSKGTKIGIATGRSLFFSDYFAKVLNVDLPLVCVNGAWMVEPKTFSTISTKFIDSKTKFELLDLLKKENKDFLVYTTSGAYTSSENLPFWKRLMKMQDQIAERKIKSNLKFEMKVVKDKIFYLKQDLLKILICVDDVSEKVRIENLLKAFPTVSFASSQSGIIDIFNSEADKAFGIESAINNFKINKREVMVFGDNENDINMFKMFPTLSVALKNADYSVRKEAKYVTEFTCEEEGVADFIFKKF
ncbi:MAG: HAD family hydrolase [Malacoplasma sp.]|nr:HAD family hydrolase [Malacoplasma sp.]